MKPATILEWLTDVWSSKLIKHVSLMFIIICIYFWCYYTFALPLTIIPSLTLTLTLILNPVWEKCPYAYDTVLYCTGNKCPQLCVWMVWTNAPMILGTSAPMIVSVRKCSSALFFIVNKKNKAMFCFYLLPICKFVHFVFVWSWFY